MSLPDPIRTALAACSVPAVLVAAGCTSYPARTAGALNAFQRGHLASSLSAYEDPETTGSPFLAGAEAGIVALTMGDWERARANLHAAQEASEEALGRGALEPTRLLDNLASFGLNDTTQDYGGEGFERVYLHACLGLTYLALGDLDGVFVEARRANAILESEEELYEKKYRAGGLGHLLSAVSYELRGELDEAFIDYERMVSKGVGTEIAGRALVRIAKERNRPELEDLEQRFGTDVPRPEGSASIVVLAGVGLGPFKIEGSLVVPTRDGLIPMAVPDYLFRAQPVDSLRLRVVESQASVRTALVESVSQVADENLSDRLALIAAKSIARGVLKRELTKHLEDEYDLGGRLVGDLFALFSERADLRAWQTLPDSWQAARLFLPPGVHTLALEAVGGEALALGTYRLEPGETMVILARSVGRKLHAHPIGGQPIGAAPPSHPAGMAVLNP